MDNDFRREFLKHLFGVDLEGPTQSYTSTDSADQPTLTLAILEQATAQLENLKKIEETRQQLASGDYDGIIQPETAQESGLPILKDEYNREYIQILETKFHITAHCPGEAVAYMIPKSLLSFPVPDNLDPWDSIRLHRWGTSPYNSWSYTDPTV